MDEYPDDAPEVDDSDAGSVESDHGDNLDDDLEDADADATGNADEISSVADSEVTVDADLVTPRMKRGRIDRGETPPPPLEYGAPGVAVDAVHTADMLPEELPFMTEDEVRPDATHIITVQVHKDERITSEALQQAELVGILNTRIKQIEGGAPCLAKAPGVSDPRLLAQLELEQGCMPLLLSREICTLENKRYVEVWNVNEMALPSGASGARM